MDEDFNPLAEFRIAGLDFEVTPVTEPALPLLMISVLGMLGVMHRKTSKSQATD